MGSVGWKLLYFLVLRQASGLANVVIVGCHSGWLACGPLHMQSACLSHWGLSLDPVAGHLGHPSFGATAGTPPPPLELAYAHPQGDRRETTDPARCRGLGGAVMSPPPSCGRKRVFFYRRLGAACIVSEAAAVSAKARLPLSGHGVLRIRVGRAGASIGSAIGLPMA